MCHPSAVVLHWWSYWILRRMAKWSQMVVSGQFHQFLKDSSTSGHRLLRLKFSCGCLNDLFFMEERRVIKRWIINSIKHLRVGSLKHNSSSNKRQERVDNYQRGSTFFRFFHKGSLQYGFWIWMWYNASSNYNWKFLSLSRDPPLPKHTHIHIVTVNQYQETIIFHMFWMHLCSYAWTSWGQFWGHIRRSPKLLKNTFYEHSKSFYGDHIWISCTIHAHPVPLNTAHPTLHSLDPTQPTHPATFKTASLTPCSSCTYLHTERWLVATLHPILNPPFHSIIAL